jgi:hypothetical protein
MAAMGTTQVARYGIQYHWPRASREFTAVAHTAHWPVILVVLATIGYVARLQHVRLPMARKAIDLGRPLARGSKLARDEPRAWQCLGTKPYRIC